jgi:hypothetical protein
LTGLTISQLITIPTTISLDDIRLVWGEPSELAFTTIQVSDTSPVHLAYLNAYSSNHFGVISGGICPYYPNFWKGQVNVHIGNMQSLQFPAERYSSLDNPFMEWIVELKRGVC